MRGRAGAVLLVLLALGASLGTSTAAFAAVEPGTPIAVAPGVPGQGRAWELVTPADPVSATLYNVRALSADGDRVSYMTLGPLPGAPAGVPLPTANFAVRGPNGWTNQPVAAPYPQLGAPLAFYSGFFYPGPLALHPDLRSSIWPSYLPLRQGETEKEVGLFRRGPDGAYELLAEIGASGRFLGASEDMRHVFFTSEKHLVSADAGRTEGSSIYEVAESALRLVDVDEAGSLLSDCGSTVLADENETAMDGAISSDGQRVFFTTRPSCAGTTRVYLRQDAATTTEISASQCDLPDCGPEADVSFVGATPSGSSAFVVTEERLTDEDSNSHSDLYRYDVFSGELTLISLSPGGGVLAVANAAVSISADGSRVYFRAKEQDGTEHLYLADGAGSHLVGPGDSLVQISADGRYALLFTSEPLVPGDTDGREDLYRYDAASGTFTPISVEGSSASGNGPFNVVIRPEYFAETAPSQPYRSMSEDGSRIFFSTEERLVPEDRNDALDVYEWADGQLGLISSGAGDRPDVYLGATPDGRSVLFRTTATLLASDRDGGEMDFYLARIGGGFPEAVPATGCAGTCPAPARVRAERALPASAKPRPRAIGLRRLGPAERRQIAASGWIDLLAEVPRAGQLSAVARAEIGQRLQTVASTDVVVSEAGPVRLRMRLSREARDELASGRDLRVRLILKLSHPASTRRTTFEIEATR